jgi:hypothetical protein
MDSEALAISFGDTVQVEAPGFFQWKKGVAVGFDGFTYTVEFSYPGITITAVTFEPEHLRKL